MNLRSDKCQSNVLSTLYLFSGARPSSGAARPKQVACRQKSSALEQAELAAPEDGRAPLNTYRCPQRPTFFLREVRTKNDRAYLLHLCAVCAPAVRTPMQPK